MEQKIRVAIVGYGNLGRGVAAALRLAPDMVLAGIFTRRDPAQLKTQSPAYPLAEITQHKQEIDICILCGGSATDVFDQAPQLARDFHCVDSFDTHDRIPAYFERVDASARSSGHVAIICTGWDPGLFSLSRALMQAVLPQGDSVTFWGPGVSQGHSDAVRHVPGVADAVQYTMPRQEAVEAARQGAAGQLSARQKHLRVCYVVPQPDADREEIRRRIITMPHYFDQYDTQVHFITMAEMDEKHRLMPHAGRVIRQGKTSAQQAQTMEFAVQLASNPEFTAAVNVAYARAAARLAKLGQRGAFTVLDVPISYLCLQSAQELYASLL